jgi:hypothetical protein
LEKVVGIVLRNREAKMEQLRDNIERLRADLRRHRIDRRGYLRMLANSKKFAFKHWQ